MMVHESQRDEGASPKPWLGYAKIVSPSSAGPDRANFYLGCAGMNRLSGRGGYSGAIARLRREEGWNSDRRAWLKAKGGHPPLLRSKRWRSGLQSGAQLEISHREAQPKREER